MNKKLLIILLLILVTQNANLTASQSTVYQANNVIELVSGKQIESFDSTNNPVQEYYSHVDLVDQDPNFRILDCALFSGCASIVVHANLLSSWMDVRADYVTYKEKGEIKPKLPITETKKKESPFYIKYGEYHFTRNACVLDAWKIYSIVNNKYFLLIPKSASLEQIKQYFTIDNEEICKQIETLELVAQAIEEKQGLANNESDQYAIKDIFQPNSSGWIFFNSGHDEEPDILPQDAINKTFNRNNLNISYDRITFLGNNIKTIANFFITSYGFKEHANAIRSHLGYLSKGADFTPYTYGIYPVTPQTQTEEIKRIQGKTLSNFFTQLRAFAKTPSNLTSTSNNVIVPFVRDAHLHGNTLNSSCYLDNRLLINVAKAPQFVELTFAPPTIIKVPNKETKETKKFKKN